MNKIDKYEIINRVKNSVYKIDKSFAVQILESNGNNSVNSQCNFLLVSNNKLTKKEKIEIQHKLYEIEWDFDIIINLFFYSKIDSEKLTKLLSSNKFLADKKI